MVQEALGVENWRVQDAQGSKGRIRVQGLTCRVVSMIPMRFHPALLQTVHDEGSILAISDSFDSAIRGLWGA